MTKGPPLSKIRKLYRFTGMGPNIRYGVHNHSLGNVRRGLVERVYMVEKKGALELTPQPNPGEFELLSRFREMLVANTAKTTRMSYQEFLGFYSGRKRVVYERAVKSLELQPVRAKDAWLSTFVKAEKLNITAKPDPAPRVIQPRDPRYNVEVGRYLRGAEELVFTGINRCFGGRTVFKGMNADQAGIAMAELWHSFRDPVGIGMDASRFDQHISQDALNFEHSIWLQLFPQSERKELKRLLSWQLVNKGLARCPDGKVKYTVNGCRMSGDMNTSSGNCIIMCATVHYLCTSNNICKFRLANNGDDCMLVVERKDMAIMDKIIPFYTNFGFTMKVEPPVFELEHIEFCQTRPVFVNGAYRMIRNCHTSLSKDLHSLLDLRNDVAVDAWIGAVGSGGRVLNDGVPVMKEFFKQFPVTKRTTHDVVSRYTAEGIYKFGRASKFNDEEPSAETRYSFWRAFGLLPDEQIALESGFKVINRSRILIEPEEPATLFNFARA